MDWRLQRFILNINRIQKYYDRPIKMLSIINFHFPPDSYVLGSAATTCMVAAGGAADQDRTLLVPLHAPAEHNNMEQNQHVDPTAEL